jgi:hypothetical protein
MTDQKIEPDEIEEETHIITERIIEEPEQEEQEDSQFVKYVVKGAAFTLGATISIIAALVVFGFIIGGGFASTIFGILLGILIIGGIIEYLEE